MSKVYFIQQAGGCGPIKIGCSIDPIARVRQFQWSCGRPFDLLAAVPGDRNVEAALHRRYAAFRVVPDFVAPNCGPTEWFSASSEVLACVDEAVKTGNVRIADIEIRYRHAAKLRAEGMTYRQIANVLGVSPGSVNAILESARWHFAKAA